MTILHPLDAALNQAAETAADCAGRRPKSPVSCPITPPGKQAQHALEGRLSRGKKRNRGMETVAGGLPSVPWRSARAIRWDAVKAC